MDQCDASSLAKRGEREPPLRPYWRETWVTSGTRSAQRWQTSDIHHRMKQPPWKVLSVETFESFDTLTRQTLQRQEHSAATALSLQL